MRKKYRDCTQPDGDCARCPLVVDGRDCRNRPISPLERYRRSAGLTQQKLSDASGVGIRQIRAVELGEADAGNLTARNLISIADALGVDPRALI